MILITAATGQVGRSAVRELVDRGVPVRALVRDSSDVRALAGAELMQGSYEDVESLERALDGVTAIFLAGRDSPEYVQLLEQVLTAAERAEVAHVVALSAIGARPGSPVALMRDHHEVEQRVRRGTSSWTFLRPHLYLQNLLRAAQAVRERGRLTAPLGDLRVPFVDTGDVGASAAAILCDPGAHADRTYALTGPVAHGYAAVAAALSQILDRPVAYHAAAQESYATSLLAAGVPAWRAEDLSRIAAAYRPEELAVAPDLPSLLGRPARSLPEFLDAHREVFLGTLAS